MFRKVFYVVPAVALCLLAATAHAQFEQGDWELTLAGNGSNDQEFRTYGFNIQGSLGYFLTRELEVAARQGFGQSDGGSLWNGDTRLVADYHFDMDRLWPYVGASIGYIYGDFGDNDIAGDQWIAGLEVGAKYFMNSTTFIGLNLGYDFNLEQGFDQGAFQYGLALGLKF